MASSGHLEREIKILMPEGVPLPTGGEGSAGLRLEPIERVRVVGRYWDGANLPLLGRGGTLRHSTGRGWTLKLAESADGGVLSRREARCDDTGPRPPSELVRMVVDHLGEPIDLVPVADLAIRRAVLGVHDRRDRLRAVVTDDLVDPAVAGRRATPFREVEIELADGVQVAELLPLVAQLRALGGRTDDPRPKLARVLAEEPGEPDHDQ